MTFVAIRLSACIRAVPTGRISVIIDIGDFYEMRRENLNLVKIGQKYRSLYIKT
jgi:hypothetical protein